MLAGSLYFTTFDISITLMKSVPLSFVSSSLITCQNFYTALANPITTLRQKWQVALCWDNLFAQSKQSPPWLQGSSTASAIFAQQITHPCSPSFPPISILTTLREARAEWIWPSGVVSASAAGSLKVSVWAIGAGGISMVSGLKSSRLTLSFRFFFVRVRSFLLGMFSIEVLPSSVPSLENFCCFLSMGLNSVFVSRIYFGLRTIGSTMIDGIVRLTCSVGVSASGSLDWFMTWWAAWFWSCTFSFIDRFSLTASPNSLPSVIPQHCILHDPVKGEEGEEEEHGLVHHEDVKCGEQRLFPVAVVRRYRVREGEAGHRESEEEVV